MRADMVEEAWRIVQPVLDAVARDKKARNGKPRLVLLEARVLERSHDPRSRAALADIYASSPPEAFDVLELQDGRVFERFSRTQIVDGKGLGRVWSLRDVSERRRGGGSGSASQTRSS